jgi:hypothetical protein
MKKVIKELSETAALGSTPQGRDWAITALHPSHPTIKIRGIPDRETGSTVYLEYKTRYVVRPPAIVGEDIATWDIALTSQMNPIAPICITRFAVGTGGTAFSEAQRTLYCRAAMGGESGTAANAVMGWLSRVSKWRGVKGSVTVQLDAPATASQGTWMAANVPSLANISPYAGIPDGGSLGSMVVNYLPITTTPLAACMRTQPGYAHGVMAPGEDMGGCYLIQNLDQVGEWCGEVQRCALSSVGPNDGLPPSDYPFPYRNGVDEDDGNVTGLLGPSYTPQPLSGAKAVKAGPGAYDLGFPNCNRWISHGLFLGMSPQASVVIDLVQGWECVVRPATAFAQFASPSPPFDEQALVAYHEIRRHMLDAYPAAYNDWDKLWQVVKGIARVALPLVGLLGPIGAGVAVAGQAGLEMIDSAVKSKANRKGGSKALVKARATVMSSGSMPSRR